MKYIKNSKHAGKLKGMTLIEVIIAMLIMAIAATMLVLGAVSVINNTKTARNVVVKVNEQSPHVENKAVTVPYVTDEEIVYSYGAVTGVVKVNKYEAPTTMPEDDQKSGNLKYFVPVTDAPVTTT